jgi:uncharacterized surface protein with fasciclin (FAS1) repeats
MESQLFSKNNLATAFLFIFILAMIACKKTSSNSTPAGPGTIATQVSTGSDFTLLYEAVQKAGLVSTLNSLGPFTVFAPTDSGFKASGITSSVISALSAGELDSILLYHTLTSEILAANVPAGPDAKVTTASGDSIFVTNNANGVFVNGVQVITANIQASNGVIHTIGKVLIPSFGKNLVQTVEADTSLSFLVAAVVRASAGGTNLAAVLSTGGIFTVFAPTNNAFRAAGFADTSAINAASPATLTSILTYHVIAGRVFSSDLTQGEMPTTVNGETVTVSLSGMASVKGNSNTNAANIVVANIMATNGVLHKIDQVLLP